MSPQKISGQGEISEDGFKDNVIALATLFGWRVAHFRPARTKHGWKTPMQGDKGFPDLVLAKQGRVIFAELKSDRGKLTEDQNGWLCDLSGFNVPPKAWDTGIVLPKPGAPETYLWRPDDLDDIQRILNDHS